MLTRRFASPIVRALLVSSLASCGGVETQPVDAGTWTVPACTEVHGTSGVTFTRDGGNTLAPTPDLVAKGWTTGLVALDTPNTLLAVRTKAIYRSQDAGCTWASIGAVPDGVSTLVRADGDRAFAFDHAGAALFRVDGAVVTPLAAPVSAIVGLAVDAASTDRVRLADAKGGLWESKDAGATWAALAPAVFTDELSNASVASFDPGDLDHVVLGVSDVGAMVTEDAGATWATASGFSTNPTVVNVALFAPTDGKIVWAQGVDAGTIDNSVPSVRVIWRSSDGGHTFAQVVAPSKTVFIRNKELLATHPTDRDVLYFYFGAPSTGDGTFVYRYDHASGEISIAHSAVLDVQAAAFHPTDPGVMYLGLVTQ